MYVCVCVCVFSFSAELVPVRDTTSHLSFTRWSRTSVMELTQLLKVKVQIEVTKKRSHDITPLPSLSHDTNTGARLRGGGTCWKKRKEGIKEGMRKCGKEE